MKYRISDNNATEIADNLEDAAEIAAECDANSVSAGGFFGDA